MIEVDDPEALDLAAVGPDRAHPWFPNRMNVEFYRPLARHELRMRVWERGAGRRCRRAAAPAPRPSRRWSPARADAPVTVHLDGGDLRSTSPSDLDVRLTGPVEPILRGAFDVAFVRGLERL